MISLCVSVWWNICHPHNCEYTECLYMGTFGPRNNQKIHERNFCFFFFSSLLDKFILLGKRKFTLFIFFILLCTHHHVKHILLLILILVTRFILLSWNERQTETGWDPEACSWYVCFCHCFSSRLNLLENLFFWPSKEKPHIPEPSYLQSINKCVRMCMIAISCEWLCFCYYADLLSCGMYPLARSLSLE